MPMGFMKNFKQSSQRKQKPVKKGAATKKLRIGILVGKSFDPVKKNSQCANFPKHLHLTKDDWGKYSVDAVTACRVQQMHPDILDVDIIPGRQITQARLKKNLVNINFWPDISSEMLSNDKKHVNEVTKCSKDPDCRMDPEWDSYIWLQNKSLYMKHFQKVGIPLIPTVIYENGFTAKQCLKDAQRLGWEKFFVKHGSMGLFGNGAIHGKTADFLGKRANDIEKYAKDNKEVKVFLLQPYTLKPNGQVFDEVRNFFIDGEWRYAVFTHGTDETEAGYYDEPEGPRKVACKALAMRAIAEVLKQATWQGKRQKPLLTRIDVAVVPKKGGDSLHKTDNTYCINEVETAMCTWLDRYAPISVSDVMAQATVKHTVELLAGLLNAKKKLPDAANVRKLVKKLNERVGPFKHIKV